MKQVVSENLGKCIEKSPAGLAEANLNLSSARLHTKKRPGRDTSKGLGGVLLVDQFSRRFSFPALCMSIVKASILSRIVRSI